jgi:hypothetical protein
LIATLALGAVPIDARAWQAHLPGSKNGGQVLAVAFDAGGNLVAGGVTERGGDHGVSTVAKLSPDGTLLWKTIVDPQGSQARSVAVDPSGQVIVGGLAGGTDESDLGYFTAVKLDGSSGAELWRYVTEDRDSAGKVVVDGNGDVVVSHHHLVSWEDDIFSVVCRKLSGGDGSTLWENMDCGALVLAVDQAGNLMAGRTGRVIKLSGETGLELWHTDLAVPPPVVSSPDLKVDRAGDVVVGHGKQLTKLSGAAGSISWHRVIDGLGAGWDGMRDFTTDEHGDVVVGGSTAYVSGIGSDLFVAKFSGVDGSERWRRIIDGRNLEHVPTVDAAERVQVDRRGHVIVAANLERHHNRSRLVLMKLTGERGGTRWSRRLKGRGGIWRALAVDSLGRIAAGGALHPPVQFYDGGGFFVARFEPGGGGTAPVLLYY